MPTYTVNGYTWNYYLVGVAPNQTAGIGDNSGTSGNATTTATSGAVTIPGTVTNGTTNYTVTEIGQWSFVGRHSVTSVIIPNSVTSINYAAFYNMSGLSSVTLGNSVTTLADYAFYQCTSLTSINIPASVTTISPTSVFASTSLNLVVTINPQQTINNVSTSFTGTNKSFFGNNSVDFAAPPPTMTITSATVTSGSITNNATILLTFTSSASTTDFLAGDITLANGTISSLGGSGAVYTATFTPLNQGLCTINVAANKFTASGLNNTASNTFTWTFDNVSPTMTITSTTAGVTSGSTTNNATIALTFTSSEATTNFVVGDISVTNGTLTNFAGSGAVYTATFTPTGLGACSIDVAAGVYTDAATNINNLPATFKWNFARTVSFVANTLTIAHNAGDGVTDGVLFVLPSGEIISSLIVTAFTGTGIITYHLSTNGTSVTSGTFTGTGTNLLAANPLIASTNTPYTLTFTANAPIAYTIVGTFEIAPTNIVISTNSVYELQPIGTTVGNLTCDNPNNASITYSLSDSTNFIITGSTLKTNAIFDYDVTSSYTLTITAVIYGLTSTNTLNITVINIPARALEMRNVQNLQGTALRTAVDYETNPVITLADLKAVGYTATELKAALYTATELKAALYTATELKAALFTATELKTALFTATELKAALFTATELKAALFTLAELKATLYTAAELKTAGYTGHELKAALFTTTELEAAGFTAAELDYGILTGLSWTSPTETILRASNLDASDLFGNSVAISGNYAIVGANYESGPSNGTNASGAAYIFERNDSGNWNQNPIILRASNLGAGDLFGTSVAISGNYAIVGAYNEDGTSIDNTTGNCGAAYIFERNDSGIWTETTILRASNLGATDYFGKSVAISGNYAIVGAFLEDGTSASATTDNCGAAYIFERNTSTGVWTETQILRASNLGVDDYFHIVAISGNYAIVGAFNEDGSSTSASFNCGAAYIFERNGSGIWNETAILRASNLGAGDLFGGSVAISGNYAIVGAYSEDGSSTSASFDCGAAYIFERNDSGNWIEKQILRASNLGLTDYFGLSVAIDGNYAIVAATQEDGSSTSTSFDSGAAYIFERNTSSGVWTEKTILRASNLGLTDKFGTSVAINGNYVIVGANLEDGSNNLTGNSGAAYIYQASIIMAPTPLSFANNTLTITDRINSTDTDKVSFELTAGNSMYPFIVTSFSGTGTVSYSLDKSDGTNVKTGTFSAANVDLLAGTPVTATVNTTYIFTLTSTAEITYTIVGSIVTAPSNIILSNNSVNELRPIGFTIGTLTCDNPYNSFIAYSVSDTTNFSITGFTLKTNAILDYETNASYPITITASIAGLIETGTFTISVTNVANEALELRNENTQGSALYLAANSQSPPISITDLLGAGYTGTELKAAGYNVYEMTAAGYTVQQLNDIGYYGSDISANRFNASYMEGYLDISGVNVTVRGSSHNLNMASGNATFSGTTTFTQPYIYNNDISLNNRLFVIGDVSMGSGNANITGNLSINGTLSAGSYNTGVIALNAIYPAFASNTSYSQKIQMNGDVSMNGNAQFSGSTTLSIGNQIQFSDGTIIRTTNKEANGTTFKASTFNNMTVVGDFASNPVLTPSDYRIKTNVQNLDETHVLDNLRPVKYYQTQSERNDIGFLAHELQEYYPDLVEGEMDGEQMQSVNYNGILALLVNEVKRLKQNIKHTKAVIAAKKVSA